MKFLAYENVSLAVVDWLRARGHDVASASELGPGIPDIDWLARAESEERVVVTSDKDFGELIFRDRRNSHGVILLRLDSLTIPQRVTRLEEVWGVIEANPAGRFTVVGEFRVRVRPLG